MDKLQLSRVKRKTPGAASVFDWRHAYRSAVFYVAADRMSQLGEVDSNLVGPAGFEFAFEFAELRFLSKRSDRAKMGYRLFANRSIFGAAAQTIAAIANELGRHRLILDRARDNRKVLSHGIVLGELMDDVGLGFFVSSKNQQAA